MSIFRFRAQALTPIHIGSSREIDPTEFVIHGKRLIHFNPSRVVDTLSKDDRNRFLQLLDVADLKEIQAFLRSRIDPERHAVVKVDASQTFLNEFELKAWNPNNQFRVDMMPRNPHSGRVYLPGSSIKGAIRTAVANYFTNLKESTRNTVHDAVRKAPSRDKGKILEEAAFNRRHWETERDAFRLVDIEDAPLPLESTRIDRASNFNPNKPGSDKIQMWVERLKARVDDVSKVPTFVVTLHLDTLAMRHSQVQRILGRNLDLATIVEACNRFYWKRMVEEGDKFDGRQSNSESWRRLYDAFPKGKTQDGRIVPIEPSKNYWSSEKQKRLLIRVGRFSHFESLSVDELRQGYNIQAKRPITNMGATRTRCVAETGMPALPFGWLLLTQEI